MTDLQNQFTKRIIPLLQRFKVPKAAFFGSLVSGKFSKKSDVDILIDTPNNMSLLDLAGLKLELEDTLKREVDIVTYNGLSPYLKTSILSEQQVFYEKR